MPPSPGKESILQSNEIIADLNLLIQLTSYCLKMLCVLASSASILSVIALPLKSHCTTVHAIALSGGGWAIWENVPQVAATFPTGHFCPNHSERFVHMVFYRTFGNRLEKTRPATARVKFSVGFEKVISTCSTLVCAYLLVIQ